MLPFTNLPPEIRNKIYHYLFQNAVIEDLGLSPTPIRLKNYHLNLTLTSHQIRSESLSILQQSTTLHLRMGQYQCGPPLIPKHVLQGIRTVRIPAHRLRTLDVASFGRMETLVLDVSVDPALWRLYLKGREKGRAGVVTGMGMGTSDVSDMVSLSMTLGVFEHSWDVEKVWRDQERTFKMLCWVSSWVREDDSAPPVLVDIDKGIVLYDRLRL